MKMPEIKFSDDYEKLPVIWQGTQATLIAVVYCDDIQKLKRSHTAFIRYDTEYRLTDGSYPLDFKEGLILVFIHHNTGVPFTTIRRFYPRKKKYYDSFLWHSFTLKWNNKNKE